MKLGEILIKIGALKESQLDKALKAQLIHGGHLGTNLIELGFVDEDTLGNALAEMSGVPYAPPRLFANIPQSTIKTVPVRVAEEYQVVPIMVADQVVHLALVNPRDLRVLDELRFAIGQKVVPWIAPEVRVVQALERFYGVARTSRYTTLGHQLDEADELRRRGTERASGAAQAVEPDAEGSAEQGDFLSEERRDIEAGYGRPWQEVAEELERRESTAPAMEPSKPSRSTMQLSQLAERYCRAETHDDLALAALEFGVGRTDRMLFLVVSADRASVWHERGMDVPEEKRNHVSFQLTSEALFTLLMGDDYYYGDLPQRADMQSFYRRLGVDAPLELLLVPVRVNDRLVAVVLADGGPEGRIHGEVEAFLKAFRLFGMSLGLLTLRNRILEAARPVARVAV